MHIFLLFSFIVCQALSSNYGKRSEAESMLNDFILYTKYSFGAYMPLCSNPLGNTLVSQCNDASTDTQSYIVRDDTRKEIVVVFRGSSSFEDFERDFDHKLVHYTSPGVTCPTDGVEAHQGFLQAYNAVAPDILSNASSQLEQYPSYSIVTTGHSLGGALASLASVSLSQSFPGRAIRLYTFGQPRTGNEAYAELVEKLIGPDNIFRVVHTYDGVPTMIPLYLGYMHHANEYWFFQDPSDNPTNFKKCSGREDPTCSDSIPSLGINIAHTVHYRWFTHQFKIGVARLCTSLFLHKIYTDT